MKKNNEVVEWIKSILFALILVFGINYFLFSPIVVDGESMMPTLESGNRMISLVSHKYIQNIPNYTL